LTNLALECGGVAAQFKAFIDRASEVWFAQKWKDNQVQLLYLAINASQHSMIWVNPGEMPSYYLGKSDGVNRLGSFLGVMGQSQMDMSGKEAVLDSGDSEALLRSPLASPLGRSADRLTAEKFGQRIAQATVRWKKGEF
jgi:NAD(P)H dehydrogenase (quinone)